MRFVAVDLFEKVDQGIVVPAMFKCDVCKALVLDVDADLVAHQAWHRDLAVIVANVFERDVDQRLRSNIVERVIAP